MVQFTPFGCRPRLNAAVHIRFPDILKNGEITGAGQVPADIGIFRCLFIINM
jgi:hypothetical protein